MGWYQRRVHGDCKSFEEIRRAQVSIYNHYHSIIRPILLSHHYGKVNDSWRYDLLCYIIKKKIPTVKDIQWTEALKIFPHQTIYSMNVFLHGLSQKKEANRKEALYIVSKEKLHIYKERKISER